MRKPFQGVSNIVRFNWPFYAVSLAAVATLLILRFFVTDNLAIDIFLILLIVPIGISLVISFYVYDLSELYSLTWLDDILEIEPERIVSINAGFDETSSLLKNRFPRSELTVFDFFDEKRHTEPSIRRARRAYPSLAGTKIVPTNNMPLESESVGAIFVIMSAHEVRDQDERTVFFKELERAISPDGRIVVVEHLRDAANLFAYNVGAFHFHSRASWVRNFANANLAIENEKRITPFVTAFVLRKNGTQP